jgi:polyhydroxyalkanoate synthase
LTARFVRRRIRAPTHSAEEKSLQQSAPNVAAWPEALVRSLAESRNPATDGWIPLVSGFAPGGPDATGWLASFAQDGARVASLQSQYAERQMRLWASMVGSESSPAAVASPEPGDRRFAAAQWRENRYFDYLKQSYLLWSRFVVELAEGAQLEGKPKERLCFAVKQLADAMCPANFAATNPEVIRAALQSRGESLTRGLANVIADAQRGRLRQSDEAAFEVGRNLAVTRGDVIHENELIQLIQYGATTPSVGARPLVMVPPCINKYYILDLQPENSFVRHALDEGHTVFMISWRNVGPEQGQLGWDDYLALGVIEALRVAREVCGADRVNALGFCIGGTLLAAALAVLAARDEQAVASATFLTTMLDFAEPGQIGLFVDEAGVAAREQAIGGGGILPSSELAFVFNVLRANDLVWPYVVNNYLMGATPAAFDLLHWNSDGTNLPGPMYCYYLRNTYLENRLCVPGALRSCGVPVDLGRIALPSFIYSSREDHIVPWRAAYRSVALLGAQSVFVLGASGHIAGVVNPPAKNRRSYWVSRDEVLPQDPDAWLTRAEERRGSWWPRWAEWLARFRGEEREAPAQTGSTRFPAIEPAPGRYVMARALPA